MDLQTMLCLLLGALTLSTALPTTSKRQTTDYIYDGSFELVKHQVASDFEQNVRSGGWYIRNQAHFYEDVTSGDHAQDGTKQVIFFGGGRQTRGSARQDIEGLPLAPLTLSYYYKIPIIRHPGCTFTVTLDAQIVDTLDLPLTEIEIDWTQRTSTFTPAQSSGRFKLEILCPTAAGHQYWELYLDSISLVDAA